MTNNYQHKMHHLEGNAILKLSKGSHPCRATKFAKMINKNYSSTVFNVQPGIDILETCNQVEKTLKFQTTLLSWMTGGNNQVLT